MIQRTWPLAAFVLACAGSAHAALPTYSVIQVFNDAPTDAFHLSSAHAINNAGQVAATRGRLNDDTFAYRCSVSSASSCVKVPVQPGGHHGTVAPHAISPNGTIVGLTPRGETYASAYQWDGSTVTYLEAPKDNCPTCNLSSAAYGINKSGRIAGMVDESSTHSVAVIFEPDGSIVKLPTLGGAYAYANGINDNGFVVGTAARADGSHRGFTHDGVALTELGTLGGANSEAMATNLFRQVVGCANVAGDGPVQAFIYQQGVMTPIPKLGSGSACANGIDNQGRVVGFEDLGLSDYIGTLYVQGRIVDLNKRLTPADREAWRITSANGINARGEIAANATHKIHGTLRAVVLRPVKPAEQD